MGTSTAKLKLYKPATIGEQVSIADLNANMDKLESLLPFTICTSGARPASPFQGQTIYETDTGLVYFYNGATWRRWLIDLAAALSVASNMSVAGDFSLTGNFNYLYPIGYKNVLHNSDFRVCQRNSGSAFSTANTAAGRSGPDRWLMFRTGFAAGASWFVVNTTPPTGSPSRWYSRMLRDSGNANTSDLNMVQAIETDEAFRFRGKKITLSFWARAGATLSASGNVLTAKVVSGTGTDESLVGASFTGQANEINQNVTLTTSWQKFTLVHSGTVGASITQLGVIFSFTPTGTAGATDNVDITNIQLEEGGVATAYELKPLSVEADNCDRFLQRLLYTTNPDHIGVGYASNSTTAAVYVALRRTMRANPTLSISAGTDFGVAIAGGTTVACTALANSLAARLGMFQRLTATVASGLTAGQAVALTSNTANAVLDLNAEI